MSRLIKTLLLALIILVGGWLLYHRHQISSLADAVQLAERQLGIQPTTSENPFRLASSSRRWNRSWFGSPGDLQPAGYRIGPRGSSDTIRVASFKLETAGAAGDLVLTADICQQFDVVAIQNHSQLSIPLLVAELNRRGYDFRFVDRQESNRLAAVIFNQQVVLLDEQHAYTVNDPEDLFLYEPLVAWFRASQPPDDQAFTFTLVNLQLSAERPDQEIAALGELFRAIRLDGRGEDDVILAGDFYSSGKQLRRIASVSGVSAAISGVATNTRANSQLDNLLFDHKATTEYTGVSGVFDFMIRFNMTLRDAMQISQRLPVWADFSAVEGRAPGRADERVSLQANR
jgi:hypothetical protein